MRGPGVEHDSESSFCARVGIVWCAHLAVSVQRLVHGVYVWNSADIDREHKQDMVLIA